MCVIVDKNNMIVFGNFQRISIQKKTTFHFVTGTNSDQQFPLH